ncbi:MAG TPA: hypothetical protein VI357_03940 [Mycobacteriales bacterium]
MFVSSLALVLALLAALVSVVALVRSGEGGSVAAASTPTPTGTAPETSGAPTPTDVATDDPAVDPTTDPPVEGTGEPTGAPDPTGVYTPVYQQEKLRLQPCARYVDLDEPRAGTESEVSEFRYCGGSVRTQIAFSGDLTIAETKDPNATANDCAQEIRRAPINSPLTPAAKQSLCIVTSASAADSQGIRRKLVLMTVDSIGQDDTMNVTVTAWNIPR